MDEGPDIGDKLTAEWQPRLEALRAQGYVVRVDTLIAPLVLEGSLPSGEPFEFRSEWKQAWLYVGLDPVLRRPRWVSWKDWENPKTGDQPQGALHEMEVLLSSAWTTPRVGTRSVSWLMPRAALRRSSLHFAYESGIAGKIPRASRSWPVRRQA
jgi:hypothetical protein